MTPSQGLLGITEFEVPGSILDWTLATLARAGEFNDEAFVAWGGVVEGDDRFVFRSAHHPAQRALTTADGLLVVVDGDSLFSLNKLLFERGEMLGAQVHAHPTEAYHSDTDDCLPVATMLGAVSLVIHDFARHGRGQSDRWAWYRLAGTGLWEPLEATATVKIT